MTDKLLRNNLRRNSMGNSKERIPLQRVDTNRWCIPKQYNAEMHVPGMIYADDELIAQIQEDNALQQVANVATLPGIVGYSLAMPDIHWGYGFPVGGVAATSAENGVVSPGGIGFDINCGVRLLATGLLHEQIRGKVDKFADDLEVTEEYGCLAGANPDAVSDTAVRRGMKQLGSLGSGNHFCEVQKVDYIYDEEAATALGIGQIGQIVAMIHCGSRGFGHQIAEDYVKLAESRQKDFGFHLVDRQLACLPLQSDEGKAYLAAMACAANFAWANRQFLMYGVRQAFSSVFGRKARAKDVPMVYDVCHNIAKMEEYEIDGQLQRVCVHRKGATRAFPAGHPAVPEQYRAVGQPVLIPGDMGRYSFVLVGAQGSMEQTFGTTCHGAGRRQSRTAAKKSLSSKDLLKQLNARGVTVRVHSKNLLTEEAPQAYKDAQQVVNVVHNAGLAT